MTARKKVKSDNLPLTIELVPSSSWQLNLRNLLPKDKWDNIRNSVCKKFNYHCAICGKKSSQLHCHEFWEFADQNHIQSLKGFLALCQLCHSVKHIGYAGISTKNKNEYEKVVKHFMKINNCNRTTFQKHYNQAIEIWKERSRYAWTLDLSGVVQNK